MWRTLNRELDPEAASALARGALMQFRCAQCDVVATVNQSLLLHAMTQKEMVQFGAEEGPSSPPEVADLIVSQGIRLWMAPTRNHLMECARLYEAGLDLFAMGVFAERLRHAVESADGVVVEAVHFDGVVDAHGSSRASFVVFAEGVEEPMQVSLPLEQVRANEAQVAPLWRQFGDVCPGVAWARAASQVEDAVSIPPFGGPRVW
jgi:hypothetical protein